MDVKIFNEAFILIGISGILLIIIKCIGDYDQVEKFLHDNDKTKYYVMKVCYLLLTLTLAINIRYALSKFVSELSK
jgi:hypothetical protein